MNKVAGKQVTVKWLCEALTAIIMARCLVVMGFKAYKAYRETPEDSDIVIQLLKEIEPHFYFGAADIVMTQGYGRQNKARELADKCLVDMVKEYIAQNACFGK